MVVAVPKSVIDDPSKADQTIHYLQRRAAGIPIALVTRDSHGAPTSYYGRGDLALHLLRIPPAAMPWNDRAMP